MPGSQWLQAFPVMHSITYANGMHSRLARHIQIVFGIPDHKRISRFDPGGFQYFE